MSDDLFARILRLSGVGDHVARASKHWADLKQADAESVAVGGAKLVNIQHWNAMFNAHAIAGNVDDILELYAELKQDGDVHANDITYTMVVDVLRKGLADKARLILEDQTRQRARLCHFEPVIVGINKMDSA